MPLRGDDDPDDDDLNSGAKGKRKAIWEAAQKLYATRLVTWQALGSDAATKPAKPADAEPQPPIGGDIAVGSKLRQTVAKRRATLEMYRGALKTLGDGPINPSNV